jgi:uncharacterized protein YjbI with pentapeptide repeats
LWGLVGLAVACGIAIIGGLILWALVMPSRLAPPLREPDLEGVTGKDRLEAIDARTRLHYDLRNGVLQLLTVLAVLAGAGLGFQQLTEDRDQARQDRQLTRQGQAGERFTRAINQLSSTRVETRIGGIYGLGQIAEQSPENTGPVGEVLLAWLNGRPRPRTPPSTPLREYAPDVQAALSTLGQQPYASQVSDRLDLRRVGLRGANLQRANLHGADLRGADLRGALLADADLSGADLASADLNYTIMLGADLKKAFLEDADLIGADLSSVDLRGAHLTRATLRSTLLNDANLRGADLHGVDLRGADLHDADLPGANLQGALLDDADLSGADLHGASSDMRTRWPAGFDWRRAVA